MEFVIFPRGEQPYTSDGFQGRSLRVQIVRAGDADKNQKVAELLRK